MQLFHCTLENWWKTDDGKKVFWTFNQLLLIHYFSQQKLYSSRIFYSHLILPIQVGGSVSLSSCLRFPGIRQHLLFNYAQFGSFTRSNDVILTHIKQMNWADKSIKIFFLYRLQPHASMKYCNYWLAQGQRQPLNCSGMLWMLLLYLLVSKIGMRLILSNGNTPWSIHFSQQWIGLSSSTGQWSCKPESRGWGLH